MEGPERIPLARPALEDEAQAAVLAVLRSGQLVRGDAVAAFEQELIALLGVPHVVAVGSGTAALHLALAALGVGPGDEVVLPDFTFPGVANVIEHLGATPVTVDVSLETFNAGPEELLAAVTRRTRAVIPVDQFGLPAIIAPLVAAAARADWALLPDAACAIGADRDGVPCGTGGTLGCFSFHPRKLIVTGEGGAVATRDDALAERVRALQNHGMEGNDFFRFRLPGWNYRMSNVHAAVGAGQIARLGEQIGARRRLAGWYDEALSQVPGVQIPAGHRDRANVFQSYVVLLEEDVPRDAVLQGLRRRGVEATLGSYAIHLQPHYRERFPAAAAPSRPGSAAAFRRSVALPLFPGMARPWQERVVEALATAIREARDSG